MQLDVTQILYDLDNEAMKNPKGNVATLRWICCEALLSPHPKEQDLDQLEKVKRFQLAKRISKDDKVELSVDELALLKRLVGQGFPPLVVGLVCEMVEKAKPAEESKPN